MDTLGCEPRAFRMRTGCVIPLHHVPLGSFEAAGRSVCMEAASSRRCRCAQLGRRKCGLPTVGSRSGIVIGGFGGSRLGILSGVPIGAPNVKVPNGNAHCRIPIRNSNLKNAKSGTRVGELQLRISRCSVAAGNAYSKIPYRNPHLRIPAACSYDSETHFGELKSCKAQVARVLAFSGQVLD